MWSDIFTLNEPLAPLIPEFKRRGYGLVLGSNTNEWHYEFYRRRFAETLDCFDGFVTSHEVGAEKPSELFFEALLRKSGRAPGECVFIDDLALNAAGARRLGLHAILYQDVPQLVAELSALGVTVSS